MASVGQRYQQGPSTTTSDQNPKMLLGGLVLPVLSRFLILSRVLGCKFKCAGRERRPTSSSKSSRCRATSFSDRFFDKLGNMQATCRGGGEIWRTGGFGALLQKSSEVLTEDTEEFWKGLLGVLELFWPSHRLQTNTKKLEQNSPAQTDKQHHSWLVKIHPTKEEATEIPWRMTLIWDRFGVGLGLLLSCRWQRRSATTHLGLQVYHPKDQLYRFEGKRSEVVSHGWRERAETREKMWDGLFRNGSRMQRNATRNLSHTTAKARKELATRTNIRRDHCPQNRPPNQASKKWHK